MPSLSDADIRVKFPSSIRRNSVNVKWYLAFFLDGLWITWTTKSHISHFFAVVTIAFNDFISVWLLESEVSWISNSEKWNYFCLSSRYLTWICSQNCSPCSFIPLCVFLMQAVYLYIRIFSKLAVQKVNFMEGKNHNSLHHTVFQTAYFITLWNMV